MVKFLAKRTAGSRWTQPVTVSSNRTQPNHESCHKKLTRPKPINGWTQPMSVPDREVLGRVDADGDIGAWLVAG